MSDHVYHNAIDSIEIKFYHFNLFLVISFTSTEWITSVFTFFFLIMIEINVNLFEKLRKLSWGFVKFAVKL